MGSMGCYSSTGMVPDPPSHPVGQNPKLNVLALGYTDPKTKTFYGITTVNGYSQVGQEAQLVVKPQGGPASFYGAEIMSAGCMDVKVNTGLGEIVSHANGAHLNLAGSDDFITLKTDNDATPLNGLGIHSLNPTSAPQPQPAKLAM